MTDVTPEEGQFNIVDEINNAVSVIDYAAEQGAFRGWDTIQKVLGVRARLQAFVVAVTEVAAEQAADMTEVSTDGSDADSDTAN